MTESTQEPAQTETPPPPPPTATNVLPTSNTKNTVKEWTQNKVAGLLTIVATVSLALGSVLGVGLTMRILEWEHHYHTGSNFELPRNHNPNTPARNENSNPRNNPNQDDKNSNTPNMGDSFDDSDDEVRNEN